VNGWQGSGYSVLDPETGVGAYQISGGASGGFLSVILSTLGGFFDGQTYWSKAIDDHKSNAAKKAGTAAKFLTIVSIALALDALLTNPNLETLVEFILNIIGVVLGNASGAWLVSAFGTAASPLFVGLLVAMWAFVLATFMLILTDMIVSGINSASNQKNKRDVQYA
tara:strand:+ start:13581 stop:14081 length:501 start_codon:yes stop_codon:yes gene_type:complete